jgi:hypothetical protein
VGIQASTGGDEYKIQGLPAEQWFITLPDGRLLGPASQPQFDAAVARGGIPPEANVRRGDWHYGIPFASLVAQQQGEARAAQQRAANPYGTYSEQFARNPIGTLIAGPTMPEYRASRDPGVLAHRRRVFLRWVYLLLGMLGAAIVLPLLAGLLRLEPAEGALGAGVALFLAFWPVIFFLIGMLMFSGAHFEWSWFMNSRRMRSMRAGGGDAMAKGFYVWTGGIFMGLSSAASIVMTLFTAGITLFNGFDLDKMQADRNQQPPAPVEQPAVGQAQPAAIAEAAHADLQPQPAEVPKDPSGAGRIAPELPSIDQPKSPRRVAAEGEVQAARNKLNEDLRALEGDLKLLGKMHELSTRRPGEPRLRREVNERAKQVGGKRSNVAVSRLNYERALAKLKQVMQETGEPSSVLAFHLNSPPAADPPMIAAELSEPLPQREIDELESAIARYEGLLRGCQQFCDQFGLDTEAAFHLEEGSRTDTGRAHLNFLAGEIDERRARLTEIESQWGHRSSHLAQRSAKERVAEYIAAYVADARRKAERGLPAAGLPRLPPQPMRTVAELEAAHGRLSENLAQSRNVAESTRKSAEFFRKSLAGDDEKIAFFQKVADDAQERLDRLIDAEKGLLTELAEACRREGKTSELLKQPATE